MLFVIHVVSTPACEYIQAGTFKVNVILPIYFSNILCGIFMCGV